MNHFKIILLIFIIVALISCSVVFVSGSRNVDINAHGTVEIDTLEVKPIIVDK